MQEDNPHQEIARIQEKINGMLQELKQPDMQPKEVKRLRGKLAELYEDLKDAKIRAEWGTLFRKRALVVRSRI